MFDTFDRTGSAEFPYPKALVFRALCEAVETTDGMTIQERDELAFRLEINTGISLFSWGERVAVSVISNGDRAAMVSVQSGAKTILGSSTTHGKNRKNVRQILSKTSEVLSKNGVQWLKDMEATYSPSSTIETPPTLIADELRKLAQLRDQGVLSDVEFQTQKGRLLGVKGD